MCVCHMFNKVLTYLVTYFHSNPDSLSQSHGLSYNIHMSAKKADVTHVSVKFRKSKSRSEWQHPSPQSPLVPSWVLVSYVLFVYTVDESVTNFYFSSFVCIVHGEGTMAM